ncbi:hypothetical protein LOZ58_002229 [Ophidiomyces ophidiicola]|nr:hypothetical protein LOZ65_002402 [Ophidiomyces ophidiicola]KAI1937665.1 hypothetical protein LOZ66_003945 [Ophidiomyces ophidiicola]KAI1963395.1 hypothetical protein LOZ58_002229 [Ophidiomyces ophidiicola]
MAEPIKSRSPSILLEPPPKGVELEDPGALESGVDSEDDHFSDASEGRPQTGSRIQTPSPQVKGPDPGTVLDRLAIPRTVLEKVDPDDTRYGDEPGTPAYEQRKMDAVPDFVYKAGEFRSDLLQDSPEDSNPADSSVPETKVSRIDSPPQRPLSPASFTAHKRKPSDALPDVVEIVQDSDEPTLLPEHRASPTQLDLEVEPAGGGAPNGVSENVAHFGDEFDDFKEGGDDSEHDDFGDFDDGVEEATLDQTRTSFSSTEDTSPLSTPPPLDFNSLRSLSDLLTATSDHLDTLFPKSVDSSTLPPVDEIPDSTAIFNSERSLSLWSQLVAPPPLQPPNWTKSRIRRLFLVSLGVPVDLDEILPASKQKKLVLPSITDGANRQSYDTSGQPRTHPKKPHEDGDQTRSSTSTDARRSGSHNRPPRRRRGQQAPPELDLSAVRRLCDTTDAALDGLTDTEMQLHVQNLEDMTTRASEVLQYWLKKRDGQLGEKEAYNGVIENLVKHARQVRS